MADDTTIPEEMNVFVFFVSISVFVIQFANISSGQKDETNLFNFRDSKPADIVKKHLEKDKPGFQDGKIVYFENSDYSDEKGKHVEENCSDLNSEICSPNFEDVPTDEENREIANNGQKTQFLDQPSILRSLFLPAMISSYVNRNNLKPRWINKRGETNPDSRPEALKRAILRNKMIRLHRRDGLKVLRLRRNGKQNGDDSAVFANQQEQTVPFSAPKSWTNQEKKNMHLGSNPMGRYDRNFFID